MRYLTVLLLIFCGFSYADLYELSKQDGLTYYASAIPSEQLEFIKARGIPLVQAQSNWCWAASIETVLNYHEVQVSQESLVRYIFGDAVNQAATGSQIVNALKAAANQDIYGNAIRIDSEEIDLSQGLQGMGIEQIIDKLSKRWPLIVGLTQLDAQGNIRGGHAYTLTAIYYWRDANGQLVSVDKVTLRNPWPDTPNREDMSWEEFGRRLAFITKIFVQR